MIYHFMRFPGGKGKTVTLSYDDGVIQDIRLAQILNKYGMKGTFNLCSGLIPATENGHKMTAEQIRHHILDSGHEIAVHGKAHKPAGCYLPVEIIEDTLSCRLELESMFKTIVRGMAYACSGITKMHNGNDYGTIRQYMQSLGIVYGRTLQGDNNSFMLPEDWLAWMPTAHHDNPNVLRWAKEFVSLDMEAFRADNRYPRMFYLWGHSYEFDHNNNWDHLEELCQILGGKEDTWYATNIEIYDYVQAYNSLVYSADCSRIHNPTNRDIWLEVQGLQSKGQKDMVYCIHPGETLVI